MWLTKSVNSTESIIRSVSRVMSLVGMAILVVMMMLTVFDVFLRYAFRRPILGSTEITEYLMVCLALGMAWCLLKGRSIKMDLILGRFPLRVQAITDSITYIITFGVLVIITWRTLTETLNAQRTFFMSTILRIPAYPFYGALTLALVMFCLAMLVSLIHNVVKAVKK